MNKFIRVNYHCFISYTTREDEVQVVKPYVDRFVDELESEGLIIAPVFYDHLCMEQRYYQPKELQSELIKGIAESICMVSFISPGYLSSPWCLFEWGSMDGIQSIRGPDYPAILPIIWKGIERSEQDFIDTRPFLRFHPGEKCGSLRELSVCVYKTIDFVINKQKELEFRGEVELDERLYRIKNYLWGID